MKLNCIKAFLLVACVLFPVAGIAQTSKGPALKPGWYVTLSAGGAFKGDHKWTDCIEVCNLSDHFGYTFGGAVGGYITDMIRLEGEVSYTHSRKKIVETSKKVFSRIDSGTLFLLVNGWVDFDMGGGFTPYLGGGIGYGRSKISLKVNPKLSEAERKEKLEYLRENEDASAFAYQVGGGVFVPLSPKFGLDVGYRYRAIPKLKIKSWSDSYGSVSQSGHAVMAGIRMNF